MANQLTTVAALPRAAGSSALQPPEVGKAATVQMRAAYFEEPDMLDVAEAPSKTLEEIVNEIQISLGWAMLAGGMEGDQ